MTKPKQNQSLSRFILLLMTTAIAATAANLYYNQPILPLIANEFNLTDSQLGSIPALTQIGYAFALLFISPLGDSIARRHLITILSCLLVLACSAAMLAPNLPLLLISVFLIGVSANNNSAINTLCSIACIERAKRCHVRHINDGLNYRYITFKNIKWVCR
ncbi:MFS transporter [Pseudoalteromonas sp. NZS11]|uniref:MFS transporter n=1 Tax=Pseudoalteromonas sp. NZS11 TaxID=2792049 RepID=UPI0022B1A079|nr:MFS transporter [Pseudoalteromonas sp. NZS11]